MLCDFYKNLSDERYIQKKLKAIETNVTIHFKNESEVINPTLYISRNIDMKDVNYIYIHALKRYYYITEITLEMQRYIVQCHVDVLMSFQTEIRNCECIIERSQSKYNTYLDDAEKTRLLGNQVVTLPFPNGFEVNNEKVSSYVLILNGGS